MNKKQIKKRLEYLRGEIKAERISYAEIAELRSLVDYIDDGDVELLEWAGVPEDIVGIVLNCKYCGHKQKITVSDIQVWIDDHGTENAWHEALENDGEYMCNKCGCLVRFNEAI